MHTAPYALDDRTATRRSPHGEEALTIRAWARSRGYPIDESAGVPLEVLRTYRRVHPLASRQA